MFALFSVVGPRCSVFGPRGVRGRARPANHLTPQWRDEHIAGYIPQVAHTYALYEVMFGIMNEKQVSIGESTTCSALGHDAVPRACPSCDGPLFDVAALSLVALERCASARCAIETMGALADEHGYYAADVTPDELGEALTVGDPDEVWMMHIAPDDTGKAIWVAQRVPDDHVTASANAFVIRGVPSRDDVGYNATEWLYSDNLWAVAARSGLTATDAAGRLDFTATFGVYIARSPADALAPGVDAKNDYSYARVWRVFSLLAPSSFRAPAPFSEDGALADAIGLSYVVLYFFSHVLPSANVVHWTAGEKLCLARPGIHSRCASTRPYRSRTSSRSTVTITRAPSGTSRAAQLRGLTATRSASTPPPAPIRFSTDGTTRSRFERRDGVLAYDRSILTHSTTEKNCLA